MKRLLQLGMLLMSLNSISVFASAEQQEIDQYIDTIKNGSRKAQTGVCNELQWAGISDTRLFDVIEAKLLETLPTAADDKNAIDLVAWYSKALGMSGNDKYRGTLNKVANGGHKKLVKYGQEGIELLPKYKKWNPIISNPANFRADKSLQTNRFANMLKSDQWELQLIATKRINYGKITDPYLLDLLNTRILSDYQAVDKSSEKERVDAFQWMIRTLAALGAPKYLDTLQQITSKASSRDLVSFTDKIIGKFY
jgi:hypothetical protein